MFTELNTDNKDLEIETQKGLAELLLKQIEATIEKLRKQGLLEEEQVMKYQGVSVIKNKNCNTWIARYTVNHKQYSVSGRTQKECYQNLVEAKKPSHIKKLIEENENDNKNLTLENWYEKWLKLYKIGKVKDNTLVGFRTSYNHIPEKLKKTKMNQIKLDQLIEHINSIKASRQCQKDYDFLKMLFNKAMDNEVIEKNPMTKIDKPKHSKIHSPALTQEQQINLINACTKTDNADFIVVGLLQGFRKGEVLGITRQDLDFEKKTINIDKAINKNNKFTTTKNFQSKRIVPMFDETYNLLLKYKDLEKDKRIFDYSNCLFEDTIKKVREQLNFYFKFKDMRATFTTNCLNKNIPLHIVQSWLGHKIGSTVTQTVYTSHNREADFEYIDIINIFNEKTHNLTAVNY